MDAHPGILFREGPAGRRAVLSGGPDVWDVIRAIRDTRAAEPDLAVDDLLALVSENTGLSAAALSVATGYYADYPDEIDLIIDAASRADADAEAAVERARRLLGA